MPESRPSERELFAKHREMELAKAAQAAAAPSKVTEPAKPENQQQGAPVDVSSGQVGGGAKADEAPPAPDALDLAFLPETIRSKVRFDDKEAYEVVKSGFMAKEHHSKWVNEAADQVHAAENWKKATKEPPRARSIISILTSANFDEAAEARVKAALEAQSEPAGEEEAAESIDPLDPVARQKEIRREAEKIAKTEIRRTLDEIQRPALAQQAVNAAIDRYVATSGTPQAVMVEAVKLHNASPARRSMLTPENADELLAPYVELAKLKANTNGTATNSPAQNATSGLTEVASPTSRGGSFQPQPVPLPKHWADGSAVKPGFRPTQAQLEDEILYAAQKNVSPSFTREALRAAR